MRRMFFPVAIVCASFACSTPAPVNDAGLDAPLDAGVDVVAESTPVDASVAPPVPTIDGPWREIAGNPDLGALTGPMQQPVDFGVWQAADGTWQLWSCIRFTMEPGGTRLFYRWEGAHFEDANWMPVEIAWHADPAYGEMQGWPQAPFVLPQPDGFHLFYGDGNDICQATSTDGKTFTRSVTSTGVTAMFSEGANTNTRDPMVLRVGDHWIAYDSAFPGGVDGVYARTSIDLFHWSDAQLVARGGQAGNGPYSAECPFVVYRPDTGLYYLLRTQRYGATAQTSVYASRDPMNFGIDDDRFFVTHLPVAAPEIVSYQGETYIFALRSTLDGIHVAHLSWVAP